MKTEWDYTKLADAYLERPDYAPDALDRLLTMADLKKGDKVCDVGAGVAHLTIPLAKYGLQVDAVEPNDAMRANGKRRTLEFNDVQWSEGTGEATGRPSAYYDLVTFGSSFNVCDRQKALMETARLLKPGRYFFCLWNHRDLDDPLQRNIETIIKKHIQNYGYGSRRENQSEEIAKSGLFEPAQYIEGKIIWRQPIGKTLEAWKSHATLERQAAGKFDSIIEDIEKYLIGLGQEEIEIPYTTRAWIARKKE